MGQRLSLLAPSAPTVAISSYVDALERYQFVELLNDSRFLKTIKAIDRTSGYLVIIKILIKPSTDSYTIQFQDILELLVKQSSILYPFKNVLAWHKLIETDRAGYLIRPMGRINLYDRLSLRPFLEPIEKLFITFQLLKTVSELHSLNVHHGDLRLENILVTSSNWILLTDFASLIKPIYLPEDNPSQYSFYFNSSDRRVCYIAPERFYNSQENPKTISNFTDDGAFNLRHSITDEMDLFSLGCVIAELWLDGEPTFTLSQLFKFIKGDYVPELSSVQNPQVIRLVQKLIKVNPTERTGARELLEEFRGICFPTFFYTYLYELMETLNDGSNFVVPKMASRNEEVSISDEKINYVFDRFKDISESLGFVYADQNATTNTSTTNNKTNNSATTSTTTNDPLPMKLILPGIPKNYRMTTKRYIDEDVHESALIIMDFVNSLSRSLKLVESKIKCCELILAFSDHINDESKLDRSLPYLCSMLDEYIEGAAFQKTEQMSPKVVCTALYAITTLVMSCSYITPINVLLFPEYLLPKVHALLNIKVDARSKRLVNGCVATCLPYLAIVAKKFWIMSKAFKAGNSTHFTMHSPDDVMKSVTTMNISKSQLDSKFKELTLLILTDSEASVKVSLLENILPLCQFFGKDKTNDIVLPHLISYLNDPTPTLRLAFLSAVLEIGPFIGALSFEQYILPLLIQTVGEGEQLVALKVLEIFNFFVSEKLINSKLEFNALEIYTEILSSSIFLLLHPNEWIRQSIVCLIISISDNLSDADRYCFLYPLVKGYLQFDLFQFNWSTLYPSLTRPLSKQAFDMMKSWALNFTTKSLFWQQKGSFSLLNHREGFDRKKPGISNSMGRSVYLPKPSTVISYNNGRSKDSMQLSSEDRQWLLKLKSLGLEEKSYWKLLVLREYIFRVSRAPPSQAIDFEDKLVTPRNYFLDVVYKTEALAPNNQPRNEKFVRKSDDEAAVSLRSFEHGEQPMLVLPNMERVLASVQTVEANIFGEMEQSTSLISKPSWLNDANIFHKTFHADDSKITTCHIKHDYNGSNPHILNFLKSYPMTPTLNDFPSFGKVLKARPNVVRPQEPSIFDLNVHRSSEDIDAFTCLTMAPNSEIFATGSESGVVKVWDIAKLDNVARAKYPSQSVDFKSRITSLTFLKNRFCLIVTTRDGMIRILKLDVIRNKNRKISKIAKPVVIRQALSPTFITHLGTCGNLIYAIDYQSRIIVYDMITMEKLFSLQNPLAFGLISDFALGDAYPTWLVVATQKGYLSLWDLRFKLLLKSWQIEIRSSESKILVDSIASVKVLFPNLQDAKVKNKEGRLHIRMKSQLEEMQSVWEIPSMECSSLQRNGVVLPYKCVLVEVTKEQSARKAIEFL
ncbi:uncharacterized protein LODBEIA_P42770 [Lodderomyces beijingensis]|uniref:non-specific serine/threonine protein kinase n=1 Tax=Lodderomyces beijingensis TaxID=1775926 RepID=A0ABP0ZQV1_9ASCO